MIEAAVPVLAGGIRSIAGWLENAMQDGKIDKFEWLKLGETVLRVSLISGAVYFGLGGMGVDVEVMGASAAGLIIDIILKRGK